MPKLIDINRWIKHLTYLQCLLNRKELGVNRFIETNTDDEDADAEVTGLTIYI